MSSASSIFKFWTLFWAILHSFPRFVLKHLKYSLLWEYKPDRSSNFQMLKFFAQGVALFLGRLCAIICKIPGFRKFPRHISISTQINDAQLARDWFIVFSYSKRYHFCFVSHRFFRFVQGLFAANILRTLKVSELELLLYSEQAVTCCLNFGTKINAKNSWSHTWIFCEAYNFLM